MNNSDIKENEILHFDEELIDLLLIDRTRSQDGEIHNIIWATDNYAQRGDEYSEWSEIKKESITGRNGQVLRPRVNKSKAEQEHRSREKAEVFTTAWICNKQNNLIDVAWFGTEASPFNDESDAGWVTNPAPIPFPTKDGKTWQDYVKDIRLEMACGEAPYLVSRYNVITGEDIAIRDRIGLLDRKLRVVSENVTEQKEWMKWVLEAYKSIYGFEWQGDNLVLAREAMIYSFMDYHQLLFGHLPSKDETRKVAEIVSWNLWQMDGLKAVIPGSCHDITRKEETLFGDEIVHVEKCEGCEKDNILKHNGTYCRIMDWKKKETVRFVDLIKQ